VAVAHDAGPCSTLPCTLAPSAVLNSPQERPAGRAPAGGTGVGEREQHGGTGEREGDAEHDLSSWWRVDLRHPLARSLLELTTVAANIPGRTGRIAALPRAPIR
jgi:hypothetical protein